jgi:hypothetical protein
MELELLIKSWENLENKMKQATTFNEKLVERIISSRVMTTVDKIKRLYNSFYAVLTIEIIFLIGILFGNPFDFRYKLQFLPYGLLLTSVIIAFLNLLHLSRSINKISPDLRVDHYLKGIVSIYERNKRFEKWFALILLSIGLLVPFSFLPNKLDRMGLTGALIDTAIMITVSLTIYVLAFKLGAFKNRYKEKLQKDLDEWNELKALAGGMEES